MDDSDLSAAERSAIEEAERVAQGTHWDVLGLTGDATANDVKRAYFAVSKRFHPDRYYGKKLGKFRPRVEALFVRAKKAHDVLVDDEERKRYSAKHPPPQPIKEKTPEEIAADRERAQRLEQRRKQLADERSAKRKAGLKNDLLGLRMRKLVTEAQIALAANDITKAKAAVDALAAEDPYGRDTLILSGLLFEKQGKRALALESYRAAQQLDGTNTDVTKAIQRLTGRE